MQNWKRDERRKRERKGERSVFSDKSCDPEFRDRENAASTTRGIPSWCCSDTHSHRKRRKLNASASEMTSATTAHFLPLVGGKFDRIRAAEWSHRASAESKREILCRRWNGITKSRVPRRICHRHGTRLIDMRRWSDQRPFQKVFVAFFNRADPREQRNRRRSTSLLSPSFQIMIYWF